MQLDRDALGVEADHRCADLAATNVENARSNGAPGRARVLVGDGRDLPRVLAPREARELAGHLAVEPSDVEVGYVEQAATPNNQSTGLFAGICAIVGILFTFNAMLLTVPERRRIVAELRMQGYSRRQVLVQLAFESTMLSVLASLAGLLLGDMLSLGVFHSAPGYLSFAFPVGGQRIVHAENVMLALAGGICATFVATAPLVRDLFSRAPVDAVHPGDEEPGETISPRIRTALAAVGALALWPRRR